MAPPTIEVAPFGESGVKVYTLANDSGLVVRILDYGGIIQSVSFPDAKGRPGDVSLGFSTFADYEAFNPAPHQGRPRGAGVYFGALVGRYANRIAAGRFSLGAKQYQVPVNNGLNSLHGGTTGFDQKIWSAATSSEPDRVSLELTYLSPDGEMGFPGRLTTTATYTLDRENRLGFGFAATTTALTVVNLTNHAYWNLAGEGSGSVLDQLLQIEADNFTPVDASLIPTGEIRPVAGTPFDFRVLTPIGQNLSGGPHFTASDNDQLRRGQGYDHNWVLNQTSPSSLIVAARAVDPSSGRELTVYTTQPGLQFYSGNSLAGNLVGSGGGTYGRYAGFALETQHLPDSPNQPGFVSTELAPGETYTQSSVYRLTNTGG
jgi:aldose 1-epimerase